MNKIQNILNNLNIQIFQFGLSTLLKEKQNRKLQNMLNKTIEFAQTVRNSPIGKIFFGKKAKEVLENKYEEIKQLPDGR